MPNDFIRSTAANKNDMKNTTVISLHDLVLSKTMEVQEI